jgi:hypothetical protein
MASEMAPGDVVKTTAVNVHFENAIAKGHYGMKAEKGQYMVFLFLGTTKRDGSEPLDVVATVKEMGWTPDEMIAAQHDLWLTKHPDARTPFGPVTPPQGDPIVSAVRAELQPLEDALIDAGHKLAKDASGWQCATCGTFVVGTSIDLQAVVCGCGRGKGRWGVVLAPAEVKSSAEKESA